MATFVIDQGPSQVANGNGCLGPTATDYEKKTQREHIYTISDTYIGADVQKPRSSRVMYQNPDYTGDNSEPKFKTTLAQISFPEGSERIFIEIISNGADNLDRSIRAGVNPGAITITMDRHWITVKNGGVPIPVEIHPTEGMYVPQMIFGELLTSSNYSGDRTGCGRNGYGAKLTNIYAKQFIVKVQDAVRHLQYLQEWKENMTICQPPVITEYHGTESFVEVSYLMDFARFDYEPSIGYPDEVFMLFFRHAADISFSYQIPVIFNGTEIAIFDIKEYARLQFGQAADTAIVYRSYTDKALGKIPTIDLCILDTPASGAHVGISNGMWNRDGGNHVDAALTTIAKGILPKVNRKVQRKNKDGTLARTPKLDIRSIKNHVSILLSVHVTDPKFDSQMKFRLTAPEVNINIPAKLLKKMDNWDLVDSLRIDMDRKYLTNAKKTDGVKKKYIRVPGSEDANDAGTAKSHDCTLCIVEGKSAKAYATTMVSFMDNGRQHMGVMPIRGKLINAMNAAPDRVDDNKEIISLKKMLGLKEAVDYSIDSNFQKLRYGRLLLMVDADVDGTHIASLVMLYFYRRFPELLQRGFICLLRTPLLRVTINGREYKFICRAEYEQWLTEDASRRKYKPRYFKGLGGTSDEQIQDDMSFMKQVIFVYDDLTPKRFRLAFSKDLADERKKWLAKYESVFRNVSLDYQPISKYIDEELIEFSMADTWRSIPGFDGLKSSQRKILWTGIKKWGGALYAGRKCKEFKVGRYANHAAEVTDYSHAETAMSDTIVAMTWHFTGSNNLAYFKGAGQFGTRNEGGKDAANTRYTYTHLLPWIAKMFRKEDQALLEIHKEEGAHNEPYFMLSVIPMALVNGAQGIGTGHSSQIPCHNPKDIIRWIYAWLIGEPLPPVLPWYRGFTGGIEIVRRTTKKKKSKKVIPVTATKLPEMMPEELTAESSVPELPLEPEAPVLESSSMVPESEDPLGPDSVAETGGKLSMRTIGRFEEDPDRPGVVWVTELPIGRWTLSYYEFLAAEMAKKPKPKTEAAKLNLKLAKAKAKAEGKILPKVSYPIITGFNNHSKKDGVCFELLGVKRPTLNKLRLVKSYGISNMTLLDRARRPIIFTATIDLLQWWCKERYQYYELRKLKMIADLKADLNLTTEKARFIHCVAVTQEIEVRNVSKQGYLFPAMTTRGFDTDLINKVNLANCTEDEIKKLLMKAEQMRAKIAEIEKKSAKDLWLNDLVELDEHLMKRYPEFYA
uniref:DNA topoisomerase 2 n=1 Tax=Pithovirus LCPAC103 TaxID=2506588 RepID=A0A481Z373_9VIRU|nr:MAG: DNA topoisomerase II [Pithovirus LCPAC103]